jgi:hypothetical protein
MCSSLSLYQAYPDQAIKDQICTRISRVKEGLSLSARAGKNGRQHALADLQPADQARLPKFCRPDHVAERLLQFEHPQHRRRPRAVRARGQQGEEFCQTNARATLLSATERALGIEMPR